jgi:hypothetical protein
MTTLVRTIVLLVLGLTLTVGAISVVARTGDGPLGPFPGGALESGDWAEPPQDWARVLAPGTSVALQVNPVDPRSVTTTSLLSEGRLYVPSLAAARKRWPQQVLEDPRVVLRHAGRRYHLRAERVSDRRELAPLRDAFEADDRDGSTWYFRLDSREEGDDA